MAKSKTPTQNLFLKEKIKIVKEINGFEIIDVRMCNGRIQVKYKETGDTWFYVNTTFDLKSEFNKDKIAIIYLLGTAAKMAYNFISSLMRYTEKAGIVSIDDMEKHELTTVKSFLKSKIDPTNTPDHRHRQRQEALKEKLIKKNQ